ncbi:MAG: rhomboid family intramembrane serine protease [Clostridia bacterium]|nr:rhomboid family intramembrane serine protease [Clostridia bacterium]
MGNRKIPLVTAIILALNLICFAIEYFSGSNRILYAYGMYQGALQNGEWYRLITNAFLHFDIAHLACNMLCLFSFGMLLENGIGRFKYALIYAFGIIGSGLLIEFAGGARALHAGASGAIWALMGASLIYVLKYHGNPSGIVRSIVLNLIYSFSAGVSWQGHIGGGIAGLAAAAVMLNLPAGGQEAGR